MTIFSDIKKFQNSINILHQFLGGLVLINPYSNLLITTQQIEAIIRR